MSKVRWQIQFSMSSLVLLMTVACVGVAVYRILVPPTIDVLVATEHLYLKTIITNSNVEFASWPSEIVPDGAVTASDGIPVGDVILTRLRKGQALVGDDVCDPSTFKSISIPPGMRVVNVKLPIFDGSSGLLEPGERVDVFIVDVNGDLDPESKPMIENVRVFNIGLSPNSNGIVGLLVTEEQGGIIASQRRISQLDLRPIDRRLSTGIGL